MAFARFVRHTGALRAEPPPGRTCSCPWHATWEATDVIIIQETLGGVFYALFHAAVPRGAFADGVETRDLRQRLSSRLIACAIFLARWTCPNRDKFRPAAPQSTTNEGWYDLLPRRSKSNS